MNAPPLNNWGRVYSLKFLIIKLLNFPFFFTMKKQKEEEETITAK